MAGLSEQQRRFADYILEGKTQIESHKLAGYKGKTDNARAASASEILRNPNVAEYISERQQKAAERTEVTLSLISGMLLKTQKDAVAAQDLTNARQSAMDLAKLHGLIVDKSKVEQENVHYVVSEDPMSEEEWEHEYGNEDALVSAARPANGTH